MDALHEMLIEDEIAMCGLVTMVGIVVGVVSRVLCAVWQRRTGGLH